MTALFVFNSLRSVGVRFRALPRLLRPASAQQMSATASTAVGGVPKASATAARFPLQAACFSTGSWLQTEHTCESAEAKEQALQQMVELLPQLEPLGVTPQLLRKVLTCRSNGSVMKASTAHKLKDRFVNIHELAAADTVEQRTLVNKQLSSMPMLLTWQANQVAANASELRNILCQQFNAPPTQVQLLFSKQISVLARKPQSVADKLKGWASILQLDVGSVVQDVWCKHTGTTIVRASTTSVATAVQQLQSVLQLGVGDVRHLALTRPSALTGVTDYKLRVLSQLLGSYGWTQKQLREAILKYPVTVTYSADSVNHHWKVFHQYAAAHPPSQQQLQDKCRDSAMLRIFSTSKARLQLMLYIMQRHEQHAQQGHPVSSSASTTHQLVELSGHTDAGGSRSKLEVTTAVPPHQ